MAPVVMTDRGRVEGEVRDGVTRFLGIPYAASPVGRLRFAAPEPAAAWDGVRPATAFGATPPCSGYRPPIDQILHQHTVPGDDWLTVNVWTPDPGATGLPVMVWVYGGAFVNGSSAIPVYDGTAFARDGVVLVTFNYRLGVEGFAQLPGAPDNRGLLDQVAALQWVQDNIAAFGGDPSAVTVFGESAGAMSITSLMAAPRAQGLFSRAITQSGAAQAAADPADAALVTAELARVLGREVSAESLRDTDVDTLVTAQRVVSDALATRPDPARFGASVVASSMAFIPVVDGDLLPQHPLAALAGGAGADVALLTGTTTEEFRFFMVPTGLAAATTPESAAATLAHRGMPPTLLDVYRADRPGASAGDLLCAVITDAYFRMPSLAVVQARRPAPSWVYEFAWASKKFDLGAAHAVDIPFVFDTVHHAGADGLVGDDAPQRLADDMHAAWVRFATSGDPGWAPYDDSRLVRTFDGDGARDVRAPREAERAVWERR